MSTSRWMPPYTSIQRIMAPPTAGPCMMKVRGIGGLSDPCRLDDRPDPAADPVSAGRHPAAGRAFARRHPAADPGAGCLAAAGSASVGSGCSCALSSRVDGAAPWRQRMEPQKVATQNEQCACEFARYRRQFPPKFRRELKNGSQISRRYSMKLAAIACNKESLAPSAFLTIFRARFEAGHCI